MSAKNVTAPSSNSGRCWRRRPGVICLSVTSDGTTGKQWVERLKSKGYKLGEEVENILRSDSFKPTNGVTTEIEILLPRIWKYRKRTNTKEICAEASRRKLWKPKAEVACLTREALTDEDLKAMSFRNLIVAHDPIASDSERFLLCVSRNYHDDDGNEVPGLGAFPVRPLYEWDRYVAFAFAVPPTRRKRG